jgi:hypothetical protein
VLPIHGVMPAEVAFPHAAETTDHARCHYHIGPLTMVISVPVSSGLRPEQAVGTVTPVSRAPRAHGGKAAKAGCKPHLYLM